FELVLQPQRLQVSIDLLASGNIDGNGRGRFGAVIYSRANQMNECVVMLSKAVSSELGVVPSLHDAQGSLATNVGREAVVRRDHAVGFVAKAFKSRTIEVVRRRQREQNARADRVHPGKVAENVLLPVPVPDSGELLVRIIGYLEEICTRRAHKPELIVRRGVED